MSAPRTLMIVGDYTEDYEVMVAFQMLQLVGQRIDTACPDKAAGDTVITSIHDFEGEQTYSEKRGHFFRLNTTFADVDPQDYDGLMIPGGRAPEYQRLDERILEMVRHFLNEDKPLAAICHGPQILVASGGIEGRECTAYPAVKPELVAAGARWIEPSAGLDSAHTDGRLVTAAAWPGIANWVRAYLQVLGAPVPA